MVSINGNAAGSGQGRNAAAADWMSIPSGSDNMKKNRFIKNLKPVRQH
jgi:hypothetical protein